MGINWTPQQQKVIESRNRNLLVSAAAGSGKTAVLVERIVQMITDQSSPVDIDQLLVMTFTKAAAAEMKERVSAAIERRLEEHREDVHLQMQAALIPHAQITTIDSFCLSLVREHFNSLDIDPAFRIADEGEAILLQADVMKRMLEDYYESADEIFEQFVETYAAGKADGKIAEYIMQVYTFSQSNPWPGEWFEKCRKELETSDLGHIMDTPWMKMLMNDVKLQVGELCSQLKDALFVCGEDAGPAPYIPMLKQDLNMLTDLEHAEHYEKLNDLLKKTVFGRLAAVRSKEIDPEKKDYVTSCRDRVKKSLGKLKELYCFDSVEDVMHDIRGTRGAVEMLLCLAEDFSGRYQEAKKEKNIVDFNDLEHYALDILVRKVDGKAVPTEVADELSSQYVEILVDEYQDSNEVQETLITSISRERFDTPNVFMVGDVKQSIYKFRLAKPELFLDKYRLYGTEEGPYQKIELHQNFRSRATVLSGINQMFYRIMTKNLGNIQYTEETALHPGAEFAETKGRAGEPVELLMVNADTGILKQLDEDSVDYTSRELEAKLIAGKIRELSAPGHGLLIWDKNEKKYRTARFGDMVILLRSTSGWSENFLNVLRNEGIPAHAESRTGYFTTIEVETVLSILAVIDNPMQDIPLAAVLSSPVAGLTDQELAHMVSVYKKRAKKGQDRGIYAAWRNYLERYGPSEDGQTDKNEHEAYQGLYKKLEEFRCMLEMLRQKSAYLTIHELIFVVFEVTGYYDYISAMPAGKTRRANLDMLVEKAAAYEKTSYKGVFHFIRYIERLKKYNTDFGEASLAGEEDNTVRIMSIHKSKGLEFPIVFLAGMGKKFNKRDVYSRILIDPDLGIGTDYLDLDLRLKAATLKKNVLRRRMELEALGEELRILYVAVTRAKEKLIMTAVDRHLEKKLERFQKIPYVDGQVPFTILSSADSYLDWVLMSLSENSGENGLVETREIAVADLVGEEIGRLAGRKISKEELLEFKTETAYDKGYREHLEKTLAFCYPYDADIRLHTKMSVSEIKRQGQMVDEEESDFLPTIPAFMSDEAKMALKGASRGTAYHRVMELLDFSAIHSHEDTVTALEELVRSGRITEDSFGLVDAGTVWGFLSSPLGVRMKKAQANGSLHKEQQFVIGIPACEIEVSESEELVLIQGIIDAYLEVDGGLLLVDYKTDRILPGQENLFAERYGTQLTYYQKALEQMTGKRVVEKIIYSLYLQKEINIGGANSQGLLVRTP